MESWVAIGHAKAAEVFCTDDSMARCDRRSWTFLMRYFLGKIAGTRKQKKKQEHPNRAGIIRDSRFWVSPASRRKRHADFVR
jgi:hypothetical protein